MKLFKRGETWWVTYGSRPQRRVSTGLKDKSEAEKYALRIIAPAMTDDSAALIAKIADIRKRANEQRAGYKSLDGVLSPNRYCQIHGVKPSSAAVAFYYWRQFVRFCNSRGISDIDGVTGDVCMDFVTSKPPRAAQHAVIYCRQILRDAGCTRDVFPPVPRHTNVIHHEPLTPDKVKLLFETVDNLAHDPRQHRGSSAGEFAWYVRFLVYTGLRMGDCATLKFGMYDEIEKSICRTMEKTSRTVAFPVHSSIIPYFAMLSARGVSGDDYLFPKIASVYLHDHRNLSQRFAALMDKIGLDGKPGQYCAHCLRATFATLCAEHGIPLAVIQSWLGHTSPMVTRIYARIEDMKRKREALERFPDLG